MDLEFMAVFQVRGFNDWLIEELRKWNCREIVLFHPEKPPKRKTDRRDARKLGDLLCFNRERLAADLPLKTASCAIVLMAELPPMFGNGQGRPAEMAPVTLTLANVKDSRLGPRPLDTAISGLKSDVWDNAIKRRGTARNQPA